MGKGLATLWVQAEVGLRSALSKICPLQSQIQFVGKVRKQQSPVVIFSDCWQAVISGFLR